MTPAEMLIRCECNDIPENESDCRKVENVVHFLSRPPLSKNKQGYNRYEAFFCIGELIFKVIDNSKLIMINSDTGDRYEIAEFPSYYFESQENTIIISQLAGMRRKNIRCCYIKDYVRRKGKYKY